MKEIDDKTVNRIIQQILDAIELNNQSELQRAEESDCSCEIIKDSALPIQGLPYWPNVPHSACKRQKASVRNTAIRICELGRNESINFRELREFPTLFDRVLKVVRAIRATNRRIDSTAALPKQLFVGMTEFGEDSRFVGEGYKDK